MIPFLTRLRPPARLASASFGWSRRVPGCQTLERRSGARAWMWAGELVLRPACHCDTVGLTIPELRAVLQDLGTTLKETT